MNGTVNDNGTTVSTSAPGFIDEAGKNFSPALNSSCCDSATNIPPGGTLAYEYKKHQQFRIRQLNGPLDIGAYEYVDVSTEVGVNRKLSREIDIYPIPAQNVLHLRNTEHYSDLQILCLTGQVLYREKIQGRHNIQIEIARFPAGIFYVMLTADGLSSVKTFVKKG